MRPKQLEGTSKKWNICFATSKGFIEELNANISFNVYRFVGVTQQAEFYMSAYNIEAAKQHLENISK